LESARIKRSKQKSAAHLQISPVADNYKVNRCGKTSQREKEKQENEKFESATTGSDCNVVKSRHSR